MRYDPQEAVTANERAYVIVDLAQRTSTVVNVGQKTYMQRPADCSTLQLYASGASPCPPVVPAGGSCKDDGPEAIAGRHAERWEMSQSMGGGGQPNQQTVVSRIWVDAKLQIWVKMETTAGAKFVLSNELQDIQEDSQPASLFEIPSDYRKMTLQDFRK